MASSSVTSERFKAVMFLLVRLTLSILLILLFPLIIFAYGMILLYRLVILKLAKHFDPKLGKMVSAISSIFAAHDAYENSYTINVALHIGGPIDVHHVVGKYKEIIGIRTPEGHLRYPELRQKIVRKFGYTFWKNVDDFKVGNHVAHLNPSEPDKPVTLAEVHEVLGKFGKTPLDPSQSPWAIYVIRNFIDERNPAVKSGVICRYHHSMFDGYSVLNMLGRFTDNGPFVLAGSEKLAAMNKKPKWWISLLKPIIIVFLGSYELAGQMISYDDNQLTQTSRREFNSVMRFHECEPLKIDELKEMKNHYKVTMSTLNTALLLGALRKFLDKRNIQLEKINLTFPLPAKNHPDKLRNYFTGGVVSIGMRHNTRLQLLQDVHNKLRRFELSFAFGLPELNMLFLRIIGSLPSFLVPKVDDIPLSCTVMHSSFPGPVHKTYLNGSLLIDGTVGGSISKPYPVGTLAFSYNGLYKLALLADTCILKTKEDAKEFADAFHNEFKALSRQVKDNVV